MNSTRISFILAIALSSVFGCKSKQEEVKPQYKALVESVYASVTVEPEELYQVFPSSSGVLKSVLIEEGDTVSINQLLAEVEADEPTINAENAALKKSLSEESYSGAASAIARIKDDIQMAKDQLRIDSLNYARQQRLWEKKIGSEVELENRKLKYESSINRLATLRSSLKETDRELRNQLKLSKNELERALSRLGDYSIRSRINGKVYSLLKNEGELVNAQQAFAEIGMRNTFVLKLLVDEVDITKVELDQRTLITLDAFADTVFEAKITKIYPSKDERTQTFTVEAAFVSAPDGLYNGLAGEANIITAQSENVLVIPSEFLFDDNQVKTKKGQVEVTIGRRNMEWLEITSGLDTNAILVNP
ncbi:MAG: efflux RND transporter periplasmic adaptor subunit [Flavobacteriales bacterium]|nr:efflux RND transporter periplasmic adaptor subunit [Flavobacteriales bacterium]